MPRAFPAQTVRDLIGIARLLYRSWDGHGIERDARLPELVAVGKDMRTSLLMARNARTPKQTRDAWELAENATRRLCAMVDAYTGVTATLQAFQADQRPWSRAQTNRALVLSYQLAPVLATLAAHAPAA